MAFGGAGLDLWSTGNLKGACFTALRTIPFFKHRVQINTVLLVPLGVVILIRCKFGLNSRRLMPVTFVPTPPRYLALPRVVIWLPTLGFFLQMSHWLPMADHLRRRGHENA